MHAKELSEYTDLLLTGIDLYEDQYYIKGVSFTYLCDGWRSEVKSSIQIDNLEDLPLLKKKSITFKRG